jgi:glyoxylase-like metal-dependent hydrolase (beta-lactamase superfamily II)
MDNNTYVVEDEATGAAAVIDPAFGSERVLAFIQSRGLRLEWVLNTHAHLDHVVLNGAFVEATGATLAIHPNELPMLRATREQASWFGVEPPEFVEPGRLLADGDTVRVGDAVLDVAHTPGHSAGSVCFVAPGLAIVGDVLFAGSIGRTDLPGGDMDTLLASIRTQLFTLDPATRVLAGHGPETTVLEERLHNPFVGEA